MGSTKVKHSSTERLAIVDISSGSIAVNVRLIARQKANT